MPDHRELEENAAAKATITMMSCPIKQGADKGGLGTAKVGKSPEDPPGRTAHCQVILPAQMGKATQMTQNKTGGAEKADQS